MQKRINSVENESISAISQNFQIKEQNIIEVTLLQCDGVARNVLKLLYYNIEFFPQLTDILIIFKR